MSKSTFMKRVLLVASTLTLVLGGFSFSWTEATATSTPQVLVVDADIGVDDAAAIAYLLSLPSSDVQLLGITTVAGNTSVENAANNALILLDTAGRTDIPVVVGAAAPLNLPASHQGAFVHGPDGLWFLGFQYPHDLSGLSHDAPAFLRDTAVAHPGATLLALGPLTNVANAIQLYPNEMAKYSQILWLGGAKVVQGEGNTPVSVFNPWFDPDAAAVVLNSGIPLMMVTTDAARNVRVTPDIFDELACCGTPLGKLVAGPLQAYANVETQFGAKKVALFDPTAAVLAVHPDWASPQSALMVVQTPDGPARGQTIIATTVSERIQLIASDAELSVLADRAFSDPDFDLQAEIAAILARQPDNVQVVLSVDANHIRNTWLKSLLPDDSM